MTKNILLIFFSIFMIRTTKAQQNSNHQLKFGLKAGINSSHMDFSKGSPPSDIKTSWGTGLNLGLVMVVPVAGKFSLQQEYMYSQMNSREKDSDTAYQFDYISLPLFLRYQLLKKVFLLTGPQFDLLINSKRKENGSSSDITHDTEERSVGITSGIEFQVVNSLSISAKYMKGFNHIGIGQRSEIQEFKFEMFQLSTHYKF